MAIELKTYTTPVKTELSTIFERTILGKYPELSPVVDSVEVGVFNHELLAFQYFKELLTEYDVDSIIFMNRNWKSVDKGYYDRVDFYTLHEDKNDSEKQKYAIEALTKAMVVASYFQKVGEKNYFKNISKEQLDEIGWADKDWNDSYVRDMRIHFWHIPFMISIVDSK